MGCISSIGKCIIILLNIVFLIIGVAFVAVGSILRFFPGTLLSFLFAGISSVTKFEIKDGASSMTDIPFVGDIGLALLIIGIVLFSLAIIAFCGTCCSYRAMLLLYIIILVIFIIVISALGGLFIVRDSSLHTSIKENLVAKVGVDYKGPGAGDGFSLTINILSYTLQCCGISGTADFDIPKNAAWKTYRYNGNDYKIDVTPACCKKDVLDTDSTFECARKQGSDYDPAKTNTKGCYDNLQDLIESVKTYAIVTLVLIITLLVILAAFGILLFMDMSDNKVSP